MIRVSLVVSSLSTASETTFAMARRRQLMSDPIRPVCSRLVVRFIGETKFHLHPYPLTRCSLLLLFLRMAFHGQIWTPMVHCPRFRHLQRWRRRPDHQHPLSRRLLRRPRCVRCRRRYGHRHHPHVLSRNGTQEHSWNARQFLPVFLHSGCHDLVLD